MTERRGALGAACLSIAAGAAQALSLATPWNGQPLWWLQLLALAVLAWQVERSAHGRQAALAGGLYATAWLAGTFWWLYISMHTYGGLPAPLAVLAVLALAGALALCHAAAAAWQRCYAPPSTMARALLFAALWLLAELARGRWFTGFGWGGSGYAQVDGPLAGYAGWIGVYGIGALTAWLAMTLAQIRSCGHAQRVIALVLLLLPTAQQQLAPSEPTAPAGRLAVALLQGNIPQDEKFQPGSGVPLALRWYGEQLRDNRAALVVAPETAIPLLPRQLPEGYWDALRLRYAGGEQAALIGVPLGSLAEGYTNSAVGLAPGQAAWRYDKHHLVPFGEFIPPGFRWFTAMMQIPLGDFKRGALGQGSFAWQGQRLAANICYEDLFGEELGARFASADEAPTVFVNLSNIAWFGDSVAIDQHLHISRMRALEFARPFVRATNTGATAIIDHRGQVLASLPRLTQGVLQGEVEGRTGLTLYARWVSAAGLWPLWAFGLAVLLWAVWRRRG